MTYFKFQKKKTKKKQNIYMSVINNEYLQIERDITQSVKSNLSGSLSGSFKGRYLKVCVERMSGFKVKLVCRQIKGQTCDGISCWVHPVVGAYIHTLLTLMARVSSFPCYICRPSLEITIFSNWTSPVTTRHLHMATCPFVERLFSIFFI